MKLLEYEGKVILKKYGVPVPHSALIEEPTDIPAFLPVVLKSQVPVGGRGKAGGIKIARSIHDSTILIKELFNLNINGYAPAQILAEEVLEIANEHYLALLIDQERSEIRLIIHRNGGMQVEENSEDFINVPVTHTKIARRTKVIAKLLGYTDSSDAHKLINFVSHLYEAFLKSDATLIEINPLVFTKNQTFIAADCKIELDDAASFRHYEWSSKYEQSDPNFVVINKSGNVATIANGAGLAMATIDTIAANDMTPANFLDIGGGASAEDVLSAFKDIVQFPNINVIIINIFAGITRCDEIAKAIIEAKKQLPDLVPLYIRLAGTRSDEARVLLTSHNITTLPTLQACIDKVKEDSYDA